MTFLQPWMLWGLLAATAPILIHLLNRLRYRSVRWGAMYFLRRVTRSALRRSRWRHYLILACRTLALLFIGLAMTRPMIGGRLGAGLAGAPDAILVLLDRSASMERLDPRSGATRRAHGLALVAGVPPEAARGSRIVLIESAMTEPLEVASLAALPALSRTEPTDTAADATALFEAALSWLNHNRPGRAEIWVVTDGQTSNWKPGSSAWPAIAARLAALAPAVRVKLIVVQGRVGVNLTLQARELRTVSHATGEYELLHALVHPSPGGEPVQAARVFNGERTLLLLPADSPVTETTLRLPPPGNTPGWGWIELPTDENPRDNTAYFVYGRGPSGTVWTNVSDERLWRRIQGAFPAPPGTAAIVNRWPDSGAPSLDDAGLVIWQGEAPTGEAARALRTFLTEGGCVLALPPDAYEPPMSTADVAPLWRWRSEETAEQDRVFRILRWEPLVGPFAQTAGGTPLPLAEAQILRRRIPLPADGADLFPVASFNDGEVMLGRQDVGAGRLYFLATLPLPQWSDVSDGRIWVPALWRMREEGARRLSDIRMTRLGEPLPGDPGLTWETVGVDSPRDPKVHAGIYRAGGRWLARNRPLEEDLPEEMTAAELRRLLPGVSVQVPEDAAGRESLYSEASLPFFFLAALFLLTEAALALLDFGSAARAVAPAGVREGAA